METKKELTIKTVPVEIKVLTVDGKRMTLSVFKQIPEVQGSIVFYNEDEREFQRTADPLGWSRVNEVDFLIYQEDGILRKAKKKSVLSGLFGPFYDWCPWAENPIVFKKMYESLYGEFYKLHNFGGRPILKNTVGVDAEDPLYSIKDHYYRLCKIYNSKELKKLEIPFIELVRSDFYQKREDAIRMAEKYDAANEYTINLFNPENQIYISI